ncbi:MAG: F-type H+-transporting ATPase subunit a [Microbacteriaceae bacterium]|nr:F-type H+-transporting ATPase subunit a [Microbacteriaceae bacterium]
MTAQVQAINITPGEHIEWHVFGLTLNGDTITSTLIAGAILVVLGLLVARKASAREPTKLQLAWETVVAQVEKQVEDTMGIKTAPFVVPLALTLFLFILISNLLALIPTGHHPEYAPPPASDVNLTYALAVLVIGTMHVVGVRKRGLRGYYGHLFRKPYALIPLNIVEEVMKPVTLSLRLFGNIFAGTIMVALIASMPAFILWLPDVLWKLFDAFIGLIQAFIFALLTILYFSSVAPAKEGANH